MKEYDKRTQVIKISVFITSIFVLFFSISYAFLNQTLIGTKRQVIRAGKVSLKLLENENNLTIQNALPMYDEVGVLQDAFTFELISNEEVELNYRVKLVDITTGEKLNTNLVKYEFIKGSKSTIKHLSDLKESILDKGKLSPKQTISYSLKLWIDSSVEDENLIKGKSLSYRIDVEAEPVDYTGMMEARGFVYSSSQHEYTPATDRFFAYNDDITNVIFENQISVPSEIPDDKQWDMSEKDDGSVMAYLEENETTDSSTTYKLHIQANGKIYANSDSSYLFDYFPKITSIDGFEYFDTSNVTKMDYMFGSYRATSPLDLSYFDTSNVLSMSYMFNNYTSSELLDLSHFDTSNVENMVGMFSSYNGSYPLNLASLDTSSVTNMSGMFSYYKSSAPLDFSSFNTSKVTDMSYMFSNYGGKNKTFDFSSWDTSNVENMAGMFQNYTYYEYVGGEHLFYSVTIKGLDTSNVTNMSSMFAGANAADLISVYLDTVFDTRNVINFSNIVANSSRPTIRFNQHDLSNIENVDKLLAALDKEKNVSISVGSEEVQAWILARYNNFADVSVK